MVVRFVKAQQWEEKFKSFAVSFERLSRGMHEVLLLALLDTQVNIARQNAIARDVAHVARVDIKRTIPLATPSYDDTETETDRDRSETVSLDESVIWTSAPTTTTTTTVQGISSSSHTISVSSITVRIRQ